MLRTLFFISVTCLAAYGQLPKANNPISEKPLKVKVKEELKEEKLNPPVKTSEEIVEPSKTIKSGEFWRGGWYPWQPYQYLKNKADPNSLTGLDIEFSKLFLEKLGKKFETSEVSWKEHQDDIRDGKRHFAMGAFESPARHKYAYIPEFYRYEENSFFIMKKDENAHSYSNADGFLAYLKKYKVRIGVIDGYNFAEPKINDYVKAPENQEFIIRSKTDADNLRLLVAGKIDGFLADRITGATVIWEERLTKYVTEKFLNIKAPIHLLVSKKLVPESEIKELEKIIKDVKASSEYSKLINFYFYPIVLMQTTDSTWFFILEIIGMISFAISGLIIASRTNTTLLGAFVLCLLPSVGGGIIRDVAFGRFPIWILNSPIYMIMLVTFVIFGYALLKLEEKIFPKVSPGFITFTNQAIIAGDALGLAVFSVTGVIVTLVVKADPLWLWGPFLAFLTGAGGGMLRDLFIRTRNISVVYGEIYGEMAIVWGAFLSIYLTLTAGDTNPTHIRNAVIFTVIGNFISHMLFHYLKIPNLQFGREEKNDL